MPFGWYPDVDILIATHNEETELLYKTVNGCRHMDYPDKSKVHIYICDDGNRPEMAELSKKCGWDISAWRTIKRQRPAI